MPTITPTHEIKITLKNGKDAEPPNPLPDMRVGETVRYSSDAGEVTIVFPERSPFRDDNKKMTEIQGSLILTLISDSTDAPGGVLPCRCFVTRSADGVRVGWASDSLGSGGDHHVGH